MTVQAESKLAGVARVDASIPGDVEAPRTKLCYLALAVTGPATLADLQAAVDEDKLALLGVLATLTESGHVERDDRGRYATC